jgi:Fe-S-cluster formation regulator IscX/YfhJ
LPAWLSGHISAFERSLHLKEFPFQCKPDDIWAYQSALKLYLDLVTSSQDEAEQRNPTRKRREAENYCQFDDETFMNSIFNASVTLFSAKILNGELGDPAPQVGPLLVKVSQTRQQIMENGGLDDTDKKHKVTKLLESACRSLIEIGELVPEDFQPFVDCQMREKDLYLIFPVEVVGQMLLRRYQAQINDNANDGKTI